MRIRRRPNRVFDSVAVVEAAVDLIIDWEERQGQPAVNNGYLCELAEAVHAYLKSQVLSTQAAPLPLKKTSH